jgi:hypothetical protein
MRIKEDKTTPEVPEEKRSKKPEMLTRGECEERP